MQFPFTKKSPRHFEEKRNVFDPVLYWRVALFVLFLMLCASAWIGYDMLGHVTEDPQPSQVAPAFPRFDVVRIEKVHDYFSSREKKAIDVISGTVPLVDPSR